MNIPHEPISQARGGVLIHLGLKICLLIYSAIHKAAGHMASQPLLGFDWYNFCRMEKSPLAVNGSHQQEWHLESIPGGGMQSGSLVNSTVNLET